MLLARMLALAELTWTPLAQKDYDSFVSRSAHQYARFKREGVAFRIPDPLGLNRDRYRQKQRNRDVKEPGVAAVSQTLLDAAPPPLRAPAQSRVVRRSGRRSAA